MAKLAPRPAPELLTPDQSAAYINLSRNSLYRLAHEGEIPLPVLVSPKRWMWRRADLDAWIAGMQHILPKARPRKRFSAEELARRAEQAKAIGEGNKGRRCKPRAEKLAEEAAEKVLLPTEELCT